MNYREAAKILKISPASLSLILNNKPGVSDALRKRVLSQIKELGLDGLNVRPRAASEADARSGVLCFLVYKRIGILDSNPFFLLIMESMECTTRTHGYSLTVSVFDERSPIRPQIDRLNAMAVDGFIVFATEMIREDLDNLKPVQKPFVMLDNHFAVSNVSSVAINNSMGTFKAVEYLHSLGHRGIGLLQSELRISSFDERHEGYVRAAREFGMSIQPEHIFTLPFSEAGSNQAFKAALDSGIKLPTALVSEDDILAIGAMGALRDSGIDVPGDISVIGYNDRPSCINVSPKLTTVNIPKGSFGSEAINILVDKIRNGVIGTDDEVRSHKLRIGTQLIVRESTAPVIG